MATNLTKKEKGFIKDIIETGNGTKAALNNYDTEDENVAASIASENLRKPKIQNAITEALPDDLLAKKHLELFEQKQVEYFVFPKDMEEEEIIDKVNAAGFEVITIRYGEKGKYAFYSIPNSGAIKSGLEMAYKIKGSFAPEKKELSGEIKTVGDEKLQRMALLLEQQLKDEDEQ